MVSVKAIAFAGVGLIATTAANAADMPQLMPPPPMPYYEDFAKGWYLRGDIGMSNQKLGSLFNVLYDTVDRVENIHKDFDSAPIFGLGLGYQFNNWLRADVTGEYRGKANFHGYDIVTCGRQHVHRRISRQQIGMAGARQRLRRPRHLGRVHAVRRRRHRRLVEHDQQLHGHLHDLPGRRCRARRFGVEGQLRLGGPRRRCLQGHEQRHDRVRLSLRRSRRRALRRPDHLSRPEQRQQPDALPQHHVARLQVRRALVPRFGSEVRADARRIRRSMRRG